MPAEAGAGMAGGGGNRPAKPSLTSTFPATAGAAPAVSHLEALQGDDGCSDDRDQPAVSYTHLTLPTICSV
eukprot:10502753-Prorocentrum_lima.AAC.1